MALALRVPLTAIVTASRCRALLSNFWRRIPYSLESVRARGSYCGSSFLPHKLLARPAQSSRLRPLVLSGLSSSSSYDCCTPWLRLLQTPPPSYGVGLRTHYFSSRNVASLVAVITAPSPKTGTIDRPIFLHSYKYSSIFPQWMLRS
jgi:hypothetical protein